MNQLQKTKQDFPSLKSKIIYFDSACQSLRPKQVIEAIKDYYENYPACAGRSAHKWGRKVTEKIWQTRQKIAKFINARKPEEIIFTRNTTESINLVASCLKPKKVLTTDKEHNSNLMPWQILNCEHRICKFDLTDFVEKSQGVDLISVVYTSNLDGETINLNKIKKNNTLLLVDGAQAVPHKKIDVQKLGIDFLAFSGHKMLGPSGIGVLYAKKELLEKMPVFMTGGETVRWTTYNKHELLPPPEKFEAGLQNYAGIIGLGTAIDYLDKIINQITDCEFELNKFATEELKKLPVKILGPEDPSQRGSIISFYSDKMSSHQIALMLDEIANIAVRSGQFCCHSWFNANKIKDAVRASFYFYNNAEEVKIFIETLKKILY
ncbi:MAG: aminotransferase class V-fold PLP-dependent enzyme [bacterium]